MIFFLLLLDVAEEEYKRLSEALADEGTYTAVGFKYTADYYDPSQPTEEEEANREAGEDTHTQARKHKLAHRLTHACTQHIKKTHHFTL